MRNLQNISKYFEPHRILDIGANVGEFYTYSSNTFYPHSYYFLIEGNRNCEEKLKELNVDYSIQLLSDSVKEMEFFINKKDLVSTGCSYYRECNTEHFVDENIIKEKIMTTTLDDMFESDSVFDLIKLDTQGSELDILKGGKNLVNNASGLLIECSLLTCNSGGARYEDIKTYLDSVNFVESEVLDKHYYKNELTQVDILFTKKKNI